MTDFIDVAWSIVLNLVASLIFVGLTAVFAIFLTLSRHRRIWQFRSPQGSNVFLVTGTIDSPVTPLGYRHANTAVSDAVSIGYLSQSIALAYRSKYRIAPMCSSSFGESIWNETVILIGGRVHNPPTKSLLAHAEKVVDLRLGIEDSSPTESRHIIDRRTGERYVAALEGDRLTQDYGVIYRLRSPMRPHDPNPVLIFYGLHAHGTLGAAKILTPEYTRTVLREPSLRGLQEFQLLIRVDVVNEEVFPHIVKAYPVLRKPAGLSISS